MDNLASTLAGLRALSDDQDDDSEVANTDAHVPIPSPPGLPFIGNITAIDPELPIGSLFQLAETYGPIYSLKLGPVNSRVFISTVELLEEICDESRFRKAVMGPLYEVRNGTGTGLFTAHHDEEDWGTAHRILMPAFGPLSIRGMFDDMYDIAAQLVMKWARYGPGYKIPVTDDFTRLTLDTLSLCAMGYRFNSFYEREMNPFVDAMADFLVESGSRSSRPAAVGMFMRGTNQKYQNDIKLMRDISDDIVKERRNTPTDKKDLLNAMINGRDPKTGGRLTDEMICNNMITFLIAGHETTSGLLSFLFYYLLKHSSAYRAAQQEVDDVCGKQRITVEHLPKLKYIAAALRESLRLNPTAAAFSVLPHPDLEDPPTLGKGKYVLQKGQPVVALLGKVQRDPKVYGNDADEFKPERMFDEAFEKLPGAAWKPFGNGMRGCIGRPFAWQEALLVVAMLLQNFDFRLDNPKYQLHLKQTLTIKPKDFYMRATLRDGIDATSLERSLSSSSSQATQKAAPGKKTTTGVVKSTGRAMSIFYGSNTGTCEAFAQHLSTNAVAHGFQPTVGALDLATQKLPKDQPVVIITSSYEGEPPDNAGHFFAWLKSLKGNELEGTSFAVFGCGHHDWKSTFQRIPSLADDLLHSHGGMRLVERGVADAAEGDMFTDFDSWEDGHFWPAVTAKFGGRPSDELPAVADSTITVEISSQTRSTYLRADVCEARVVSARILTAPGEQEKRHLEIQLPSDTQYRAGDYLAVLPVNPKQHIRRALERFQLPWDARLTLSSTAPTVLPIGSDLPAHEIFSAYVELAQTATRKNVLALAAVAVDERIKAELEELASTKFTEEIVSKRTSLLDILERYPALLLPLGNFLTMLPPMRVRQYSISSSPLHSPDKCTLTYSLVDTAVLSTPGNRHIGVATSYLSSLEPGDIVHVSVRSSKAFHLPLNPATPVVMIAAGSGLAPFRGFVQERAVQVAAGRTLSRALLFIGCRYRGRDQLYFDELSAWQQSGAVELRYAFSREPEMTQGCRYVQDLLRQEKEDLLKVWDEGAKVYVCGSAAVGEGVAKACKALYREKTAENGLEKSDEEVETWFSGLRNERFATDVFS